MLVMGSKTLTIEGVTVFADHADPQQFWYLPAPVTLAERNNVPQFTLIRYRPAVADGGVKGGGFLMMEVELRLDPELERKIISAVSRFSSGMPRLTPVPFDDGKVEVVALNIQGGGGTNAPTPPQGAFVAVEAILGATKPSLSGNNTAVFSLTLSQEGATILDQAFRQGATPVGVIYDLKYTVLRPALDVNITANFKHIYDHLSFGIDLSAGAVIYGVPVYLQAGIDMAFEKLKEDGVIDIQVINFSNSADAADKEKWALDFFKQNLLQQWFKPTLAPVTFDRKSPTGGTTSPTSGGSSSGGGTTSPTSGGSSSGGGTTSPASGGSSSGGGTTSPASGGSSSSGGTASSASGGSSSSGGTARPASGGSSSSGGTASSASGGSPSPGGTARPASGGGEAPHESVSLRVPTREVWAYPFIESVGRRPAQLDLRIEPQTPGYDIHLSQSAESDQVKLTFIGGKDAPAVRINGMQKELTDQREMLLDLPGGTTLFIEADYPAYPIEPQEFKLYFDLNKPRAAGWSVIPPSAGYSGYLSNRTDPLDSRFETSTVQDEPVPGSPTNADALRTWLRNEIGSPRRVIVEAHASYEGDDNTAMLNKQLTQRRADVAVGIIGNDAQVTSVNAMGFTAARNAGRLGNLRDRYVLIRDASSSRHSVSIHCMLSRAGTIWDEINTEAGSSTPPAGGTAGSTTHPAGGTAGSTTHPAGGTAGSTTHPAGGTAGTPTLPGGANAPIPQQPPMGVKLAFQLKKIEQIEDKSVTLHFAQQSAEQRSYAPQGLIGLLADSLDGPPYFVEVDLDSPFFRQLDIQIEAPISFEPIGLLKADVAIEYGRAADPVGIKHKDIVFRQGGSQQEKASFFLNPKLDLNYTLTMQYHFDPMSGWDGEKLSYELPAVSTLDRTLLVNPFKDFGFVEIRIVPGDIDADMIDSTDVHLHYEHPGRWQRDKIITLNPGGSEQSWKLRVSDPEQRSFTYRFVHRLKDGTTYETEPVQTSIPMVVVNDHYSDPLVIEFFPNYDPTPIRLLIIDVAYEDPGVQKKRVKQIRFNSTDFDSKRIRFARTDPTVGSYSIQITILGSDNSVRRLSPVSLESTIVFLGEYLEN